jgi:hypothetical protein
MSTRTSKGAAGEARAPCHNPAPCRLGFAQRVQACVQLAAGEQLRRAARQLAAHTPPHTHTRVTTRHRRGDRGQRRTGGERRRERERGKAQDEQEAGDGQEAGDLTGNRRRPRPPSHAWGRHRHTQRHSVRPARNRTAAQTRSPNAYAYAASATHARDSPEKLQPEEEETPGKTACPLWDQTQPVGLALGSTFGGLWRGR